METMSELRRRATDLAYQGQHREAAHIYEQILLKSPAPDGEIALRLGSLLRKLGDPAGALSAFERAVELFGRIGRFAHAAAAEHLTVELTREMRSKV
jgi:tetratricopeptide (TPR) repeat protein